MKAHSATTAAVVVCLLLAGCAQDGTLSTSGLNTSSIEQKKAAEQAEKNNAECMAIASQIETLHRDGAAAKVTKAASKKYKMKSSDLAKADELNKANTEFQTKCSAYPPRPVVASTTMSTTTTSNTTTSTTTATKDATKKVAAKKPPVPTAKPPASTAAATPPASATAPTPQTAENPDPTLPQP